MILGMSLATFTMIHMIISLIAIVAGLIVMFGMLGSKRMPGVTATFLLFTILTSASGFLIPPLLFEKPLPSHMIGILSLVLLATACFALYRMKLAGAWRWIYALTALVSLYLNVFVLVIQSFLKVPALHALAPSVPPAELPFVVAQGIVLLFFAIVISGVIRRYRPSRRELDLGLLVFRGEPGNHRHESHGSREHAHPERPNKRRIPMTTITTKDDVLHDEDV